MEREKVTSRTIASIGYDEENALLEIEFIKGGIYQYFGVPIDEYIGLMDAESHGRYFVENIRDAYEFKKMI